MNDDEKPSGLDNRVVVVGSCMIDMTLYVERLPQTGETLAAFSVQTELGGKAVNQAIGITRLGGKSHLVTRIGQDQWADYAIQILREQGVDTTFVTRDLHSHTGVGTAIVGKNGDNVVVGALGANTFLAAADIDIARTMLEHARVLSIHLNPPIQTVRHALTLGKNFGLITLLNASPVEYLPHDLLALVDVFVVNSVEASWFVGFPVTDYLSACNAGTTLIKQGVGAVVVSLGRAGLVLVTGQEQHMIPSLEVAVLDTTGAGDALIAGLALALAEGRDIASAAYFGGAVGSFSVARLGTWRSIPTGEEISTFMQDHT